MGPEDDDTSAVEGEGNTDMLREVAEAFPIDDDVLAGSATRDLDKWSFGQGDDDDEHGLNIGFAHSPGTNAILGLTMGMGPSTVDLLKDLESDSPKEDTSGAFQISSRVPTLSMPMS
eukprot:CAMPEP_0206399074 /NCGR_PEP_ID=MMETSP0294-20121207/24581_1 /ASSEMBLY_ACC=CAM_ASM_000327 /TAXON_ID=39354 /ORGANISM="Heterosigma akashiwo, Strain CCMP2393" /LENGTH=116 /DNA_ID=CAMNT_0053854761 /DNA_START=155 /DNA_END=502 /DNA_ORIENTATION=+